MYKIRALIRVHPRLRLFLIVESGSSCNDALKPVGGFVFKTS